MISLAILLMLRKLINFQTWEYHRQLEQFNPKNRRKFEQNNSIPDLKICREIPRRKASTESFRLEKCDMQYNEYVYMVRRTAMECLARAYIILLFGNKTVVDNLSCIKLADVLTRVYLLAINNKRVNANQFLAVHSSLIRAKQPIAHASLPLRRLRLSELSQKYQN